MSADLQPPPRDDAIAREQLVRLTAECGFFAAVTESDADPIAVMRLREADADFDHQLTLAERFAAYRIEAVLLDVLNDAEAPLRERVSIGKQLLKEHRAPSAAARRAGSRTAGGRGVATPLAAGERMRFLREQERDPLDVGAVGGSLATALQTVAAFDAETRDRAAEAESPLAAPSEQVAQPADASNLATLGENGPAMTHPYRRDAPRVGRNDPCPCGSGRKWKRCCGAIRDG